MKCNINDIRAMVSFPEAYEVDGSGLKQLMVDRPDKYGPEFIEFYCTKHDCMFKRWRAVLDHIGRTEMTS